VKALGTAADLRRALESFGREPIIGFVPTMGAFHDGHVALFRAAKQECDVVVASLFVNPSQFSDPADFAAYPRDRSQDERVAAASGVDLLFVPGVD
jgi:pantoate--beta-alanine ligase